MTDQLNQIVKLEHTAILYYQITSIEFDAKKEYIDNMAAWMREMSNYLYDVTDGQLNIRVIHIYDNKYLWEQSDIQINASNCL